MAQIDLSILTVKGTATIGGNFLVLKCLGKYCPRLDTSCNGRQTVLLIIGSQRKLFVHTGLHSEFIIPGSSNITKKISTNYVLPWSDQQLALMSDQYFEGIHINILHGGNDASPYALFS